MRMQVRFSVVLSEDDDQLQQNIDINQVVDDTLVTAWNGGIFVLAPSVSNQAIAIPSVTAGKYLVILVWSGEVAYRVNNVASQPLSLKPNPAATPDPILPYQKTAQPAIAFCGPMSTTFPLTSLFLSNPSSTTAARVQVVVVGEAA